MDTKNTVSSSPAERIRNTRFTKKEDLLTWLDIAKGKVQNKAETDKKHSAAFYHAYLSLLDRFRTAINAAVLFNELEDFWYYSLAISPSGATLSLIHVSKWKEIDDKLIVTTDQTYRLIHEAGKMLSVENYAAQYGVGAGTVRQWIRRGKLRGAKKAGRDWSIPELTEIPSRGFQSGAYFLYERLKEPSEDYPFLNDCRAVIINQDTADKSLFHVQTVSAHSSDTTEILCSAGEREKLEYYLLSHPQFVNVPTPDDGLNVEISTMEFDGLEQRGG